jgi:alpha-aminoadipate carrier protein LysW
MPVACALRLSAKGIELSLKLSGHDTGTKPKRSWYTSHRSCGINEVWRDALMVQCPECDAELDIDEEDVDEGDIVSCDECGAELQIVSLDPLEVESYDEEEEDEDEDEEFFDEEEDAALEEEEEEDDEWR